MSGGLRPKCPGCQEEANVNISQKGRKYYQCPNKCTDPNSKKDPKQPFWMGWYNGPSESSQSDTNTPSPSVSSSVSSSSASSPQYSAPSNTSSAPVLKMKTGSATTPWDQRISDRGLYTHDSGPSDSDKMRLMIQEELSDIKALLGRAIFLYEQDINIRRKKRDNASVYMLDGEAKPTRPPPPSKKKKITTTLEEKQEVITDDEIDDE